MGKLHQANIHDRFVTLKTIYDWIGVSSSEFALLHCTDWQAFAPAPQTVIRCGARDTGARRRRCTSMCYFAGTVFTGAIS
jgi:hypothetical protein